MKYTNKSISSLKKMLNPENDKDVIEYIEFLEDRNNKLASTLGWYEENVRNFRKTATEGGDEARVALNDDGGQRARYVLSFHRNTLN